MKIPRQIQTTDRMERMLLTAYREQLANASLSRMECVFEAVAKADPELHNRIINDI